MKNFKTPLAITGSEQELRALIPELEKLGYSVKDDEYEKGNLLTNNFSWEVGDIGFVHHDSIFSRQRITVPASNRDLVLALAAMVDDLHIHDGEYVFIARHRQKEFQGQIFKAKREELQPYGAFVHLYDKDPDANIKREDVRKATVEEIQQHFALKENAQKLQDYLHREKKIAVRVSTEKQFDQAVMFFQIDKSRPTLPQRFSSYGFKTIVAQEPKSAFSDGYSYSTEDEYPNHTIISFQEFERDYLNKGKIIIGYECIKKYPGADLGKKHMIAQHGVMPYHQWPEFWRPIYEEKKIIRVPFTTEIEGAETRQGTLEVEIVDGLAHVQGHKFSKRSLEILLGYGELVTVRYTATEFAFGCKGQYIVRADDIQKLIEQM